MTRRRPGRGRAAGAVLVAVVLDVAAGEPPLPLHPVVRAGRYLTRAAALVPTGPPTRARWAGATAWALGALASAGVGLGVERASRRLTGPWRALVTGAALWPLLSGRMLLAEVAGVRDALAVGAEEGRTAVARLVSRPTRGLSATEVRAAAIESLGENLSDAYVATLWWYAVGGLPAAALHRFANTADAMWGYRTPRWEHAGATAARADDLLNLVPARLTGLVLAAPGGRRDLPRLRREARRTSSPNAGWPMGAMALRLDVRLAKPGAYVLHPSGRLPTTEDLAAALTIARHTALLAALAAAAHDLLRAPRPRQPGPRQPRPCPPHPPGGTR